MLQVCYNKICCWLKEIHCTPLVFHVCSVAVCIQFISSTHYLNFFIVPSFFQSTGQYKIVLLLSHRIEMFEQFNDHYFQLTQ